MNIEIVKEKETPLLGRKRFTMWADYQGSTPSRVKFCNEIANKLKVSKDLVVIRHIYTRFGEQRSKLLIHIYDDEKTMIELEGKNLVEKHKVEEKKAEEKKKPKEKKEESSEAEGSKAEATEEKSAEDKKGETENKPAEEKSKEQTKDETPAKSEESTETEKKDEA